MRFGIPNTPRKTGCGGNGAATNFKDGIEPCSPVSSFPSFFCRLIRTSLGPLTRVGTAPRKHLGPGNMSAAGHLLRPDPWEIAHEHLEARRSEVDKTRKIRCSARQTGPTFKTARYTGSLKPAEALDISRATASRQWTYARAWLRDAVFAEKRLPWLRRARAKNRTFV